MPVLSQPKKQISDKRRQQNKQAQKKYRDRQKRNLDLLQDITGSRFGFVVDDAHVANNRGSWQAGNSGSTSDVIIHQDISPGNLPLTSSATSHLNLGSSLRTVERQSAPAEVPEADQQFSFQATLDAFNERTLPELTTQDSFNAGGFWRTGQSDAAPESVQHSHVSSDQAYTKKAIQNGLIHSNLSTRYTFEEIMAAGLKALSAIPAQVVSTKDDEAISHPHLRTDKILVLENMKLNSTDTFPDIYMNNFQIKQIMWVAACVANATHLLGQEFSESYCDEEESHFFQKGTSEAVAMIACSNSFSNVKEHLRPVPGQIMHQHHPYIDVLPFPTFRERIIKLAYADTPMIDEDELCQDLENGGLICWGSSYGGARLATGSGAPWDCRSWEAQPWFLKKWWILIGGKDGELYKQTQWWREMRGESSCYPF